MKKLFLSVAAFVALLATPTRADTQYWRDTVTYILHGTSNNSCILLQTAATGGVKGIDNSSGGDTNAAGYTGGAQWFVIGVGSGTGNRRDQLESIMFMLFNSRMSTTSNPVYMSWADQGTNTASIYADCGTAYHAARGFGQ